MEAWCSLPRFVRSSNERFYETILGVNMGNQMFNINPKGHAIIIDKRRCKLSGIIKSPGLYEIIRVVSLLGEEFSKNSVSYG
ncbi:hypothetical protein M0R45_034909 [Rubus argutus]|uniref:Uncharacterized protein n=1 Tax=Rubus argutus TaxID=59490 RepID=A0AAW1VVA7_RUBAR